MNTPDNNLSASPVMLTPRQTHLLRQLVVDRMEAMAAHMPEHITLQDDPEILNTLEELSDLDIALTSEANEKHTTGGGPEKPGMRFDSEELADIQRYAMYGMAAVEEALTSDSKTVRDPIGMVKDREQMQKDLTRFRPTFGKLTVAYLSGSQASEITRRLKD